MLNYLTFAIRDSEKLEGLNFVSLAVSRESKLEEHFPLCCAKRNTRRTPADYFASRNIFQCTMRLFPQSYTRKGYKGGRTMIDGCRKSIDKREQTRQIFFLGHPVHSLLLGEKEAPFFSLKDDREIFLDVSIDLDRLCVDILF